ncbi:tRNA cyclic N6-threonylcarbamoyladenosine(37) synthase TcdA [Sessilibacter corallicola]|uniref:tRNA cyclic N6-threonylcarbamoyladenosine(37) synthase TcdA n=1 Tax=Sessilibacter corallicola TaxID=2904075 RepID=UPI001E5208AF|nr:tRNA cyclic N6-threonylcarbamoyladenosine(37) synthase TcdA [Sessilibacter corallicola]MCE2028309.1 tRNA cyclic N6-threonylcarbamoyladenosine(37) synthase TcdA [Sessilibacter corallicola]
MNQQDDSYQQRFSGLGRLYGQSAFASLQKAHFLIIGIGGVGTWVAESLARTGVAELSLVDMDDVCITNTNRQIHALSNTVGGSKIKVMAERLALINPEIKINLIDDFIDEENLSDIIKPEHSGVIDAIDSATTKAAVIAFCKRSKIPVVTVGSAGGKRDPRMVTSIDLSKTTNDPLLAKTRNQLRRLYNFSKNPKRNFSIEAIYSTEQMVYPMPNGEISHSSSVLKDGTRLDCSGGFGSATMVTGTFGFIAASRILEKYFKNSLKES